MSDDCSVEGCVKPVNRFELCWNHYTRLPLDARFFLNVKETAAGCWEWQGNLSGHGYGRFKFNQTVVQAHRWCYEYLRAEIPAALELDHLCRNHPCVNPWHMDPVTHRVNVLRGEGASARAARQDTCPQGHDWSDPEVVWVSPEGHRRCRICDRATHERFLQRHRLHGRTGVPA